ncbi:hypothetical protein ADK70_12630 [Streptomyces rimosus subsp. pseudoverticillatus]|uniref:hypothetical protein n=1 Tax=Streptomyces rimosus TaxID=1927 RepID=UPI0006B2624F|nr:hypothetical protein [Streptomyces rimosus]KOT94514.1 hypothetical protein ADK70_12630 [Streptomyces rimosus subsp. pseudoverticillatus]
MNTTTAATEAQVTVATIRTWCTRGAVTATKTAGRWVIDAASLKARIRLGRQIRRVRARRTAPAARARILANLQLPALTGTPNQIAWAEELRLRRIHAALDVTPHRQHGLAYHLAGATGDPLGLTYIPTLANTPGYGTYATRRDLLAALDTALTHGARTTAAWWIDHRTVNTPM